MQILLLAYHKYCHSSFYGKFSRCTAPEKIKRFLVEEFVIYLFRLRSNLISKFNTSKSKFNKWLKSMEKREKAVDSEVVGVEKSFVECGKLEVRFDLL